MPAQSFSFALEPGAPAGASLDATTGVFAWTPPTAGTNRLTVKVTDNGTPPLSDTQSFAVVVTAEVKPPRIAAFGLTTDGKFQLSWESEPGARYRIEFKSSQTLTEWTTVGGEMVADGATASFSEALSNDAERYFRVVRLE